MEINEKKKNGEKQTKMICTYIHNKGWKLLETTYFSGFKSLYIMPSEWRWSSANANSAK